MKYGKGKYLLRRAFEGDYLPRTFCTGRKPRSPMRWALPMVDYLKDYAAGQFTDGSLRRGGGSTGLAALHQGALLYLEIFEKIPQARRRWWWTSGCPTKTGRAAMDDPSARVLKTTGTAENTASPERETCNGTSSPGRGLPCKK